MITDELTLPQVVFLYAQGFDYQRSKEKSEAVRMYISNIAGNSKEGHKLFTDYLDSFKDRNPFSEIKTKLSEGMQKFLGLNKPKSENEDE